MHPDTGPIEAEIAGKLAEPGDPRRRREQEADDDEHDPEQGNATSDRVHGEA